MIPGVDVTQIAGGGMQGLVELMVARRLDKVNPSINVCS
jgi:hypothetical protein